MSRILRHVGHKDFQKTRQRQICEEKERAAKKLKELQETEKERKKIEEVARPYKSNWRDELLREFGEWTPVDGVGPTNSTAQTFGFSVGGFQQSNFETGQPVTYTASGLGGVEASNTGGQTIVDLGFGEVAFVDAPTYDQLALAGYAKPLGFGVQRRRDYEDVNPKLDASQEFAQNVGADYMMNARTMTTDMDKFMEMYKNRWQNTEGPGAPGTGAEGQWWLSMMELINSGMSYDDALKKLGPMPPRENPVDDDDFSMDDDAFSFPDFMDVETQTRIAQQLNLDVNAVLQNPKLFNKLVVPELIAQQLNLDVTTVLQNPQLYSRLFRSLTDNIRYGGSSIVTGLPKGITYNPNHRSSMKLQRWFAPRNYGAPLGTFNPGELNVSRMYQDTNQLTRGTPFGNKSGAYWVQPTPQKGLRGIKNPFGSTVNRGWSGTPEVQFRQGGPRALQSSADDITRLATRGTRVSKFLSRVVPFASTTAAAVDVATRTAQGDYAGAVLGAISGWPGPIGWVGFGAQMIYDATGAKHFMPGNRIKEAFNSDERWKQKVMKYLNTLDKDEYIRMLAAMLLQEGINPEFVSLTIRAFYGAEFEDSEIKFIKNSLPKMVKYFSKKKKIKESTTWDKIKKYRKKD